MDAVSVTAGKPTHLSMPQAWRWPFAALAATWAVLLLAYFATYREIVGIWWRSGTFTHGFFILPIVGYLIWQKWPLVREIAPRSSWLGSLAVLFIGLVWQLGQLVSAAVVQHFAAVALFPALAFSILGWGVLRHLLFPMAYLFLAVPFGEFMVPYLQDVTASFTVAALQITGIPVYVEGLFFSIPSGNFEIVQACSGIRYVIASVALGTLYAYFSYTALWRRLVFVAVSFVVPVFANGLRAYGIVMLAHVSDRELATGVDHIVYGWFFFGLVMVLMFWAGSLLRETSLPSSVPAAESRAMFPPQAPSLFARGTALTVLALALPAAGVTWALRTSADPLPTLNLPAASAGWNGPSAYSGMWRPRFDGAVETLAAYQTGERTVWLYLGQYPHEAQGHELINQMNSVYDPESSQRLDDGYKTISTGRNPGFQLKQTHVRLSGKELLIWSWYVTGGKAEGNPLAAKLSDLLAKLRGSPHPAAVVVLATETTRDQNLAESTLHKFVVDNGPALGL